MSRLMILVPTELELKAIHRLPQNVNAAVEGAQLCGFGPIAAAATTAKLLASQQPVQVLLLGIAGSLAGRIAVGAATLFSEVICFGVGAGTGLQFLNAEELGWPQSPISLHSCRTAATSNSHAPALLTCCAASGTDQDARFRADRYPGAVAEDMEGYGVALACRQAGIPLTIIRGISNEAGDRDAIRWRITEALRSAVELAGEWIQANVGDSSYALRPDAADRDQQRMP